MSIVNRRSGVILLLGSGLIGCAGLVTSTAGPVTAASGDFTVAPTTLAFADTFVGDTTDLTVTVTNVSATTQTPNFAGGAPNDATNFGGSQNCAGVPLDPGAGCQFTYEFHPVSIGAHSSSTTIGIDGDNFTISMSGQALSPVTVAPVSLSFPDTAVGSTSSLDVVVTNVSPVAQTPNFSGGAPNDPTNFGGSQNCAGVSIPSGDSCRFTYTFTPTSLGAHSTSTTIGVGDETFSISMTGMALDASATTTTSTTSTTSTTANSASSTTTSTTPTSATAAASTLPGESGTQTPASTSTTTPLPGRGSGPVATGHAEVIAQGIVMFPDGPFRWDAQRLGGSWPYPFDASPPMFVIAQGPDGIVVQGAGGTMALLEGGEATFVNPGSSGSIVPRFVGATAVADRLTFVAGGGTGSFVPGAGRRDVNVVRDVLAPGETLTATSLFPLLVIADGPLTVIGGTGAALPDGVATTLGPSVELRNDGTTTASVVIAAVGDPLP